MKLPAKNRLDFGPVGRSIEKVATVMRVSFSTVLLFLGVFAIESTYACDSPASVCPSARPGSLALIRKGQPISVLADASADSAVRRAADGFAADLERVSGRPASRVAS